MEVSFVPDGGILLRDTKDRSKLPFHFNREEWNAFLAGAKANEFDPPVIP